MNIVRTICTRKIYTAKAKIHCSVILHLSSCISLFAVTFWPFWPFWWIIYTTNCKYRFSACRNIWMMYTVLWDGARGLRIFGSSNAASVWEYARYYLGMNLHMFHIMYIRIPKYAWNTEGENSLKRKSVRMLKSALIGLNHCPNSQYNIIIIVVCRIHICYDGIHSRSSLFFHPFQHDLDGWTTFFELTGAVLTSQMLSICSSERVITRASVLYTAWLSLFLSNLTLFHIYTHRNFPF